MATNIQTIDTARTGRGRRGRKPGPHPVDVHIGRRIRERRSLLGMSQSMLAEALDMTFQQVQKYERGANRVGGSRLYEISRILDVPVGFFYEGVDETTGPAAHEPEGADPLVKRETLELVRAYYRIPDGPRKRLFELTKAMAREN